MSEWVTCNTAELIRSGALEIGDGYRAKNSEFVANGGLPFVRVRDVVGSTLRLEGLEELPAEQTSRYEPKVSRPCDSVVTMKGTVGRVAFVSDGTRPFVYSPQISYWRSHDPRRVHPRWLRYWLEGPEFASQASATKGSTDMADYINLGDQRRMTITLPPWRVQARVAEILGSIDDLIENNRRRAELLEDMAQAIYGEWFVRFRCPDHEHTTFVNSLLGPIPQGWELRALGDIATLDKGLSYKGPHLTQDGTPMANLKCFYVGGRFRREGVKRYSGPFKDKHQVVPGDLVVANTDLTQAGHVIGSPGIIPRRQFGSGGIASHHLFIVRPIFRDCRLWLYHTLREDRFRAYARGVASGTTVLGLRPADLLAYPVVFPSVAVLQRFTDIATGITGMTHSLEDAVEDLGRFRDLLLPKLVTGQIDVSKLDLDALTEESVA